MPRISQQPFLQTLSAQRPAGVTSMGSRVRTKQNKTKQNKTKQNKTKQNKTKQNKTTIVFQLFYEQLQEGTSEMKKMFGKKSHILIVTKI
jgi:hypothetical protein